ncbi:MAG: VIT1/CCC1 transporter family protein [Chthonomonadetes bacterium]|nr:VIT1/CCC1 transporter family protein [Chthonomonadetes bacterium]
MGANGKLVRSIEEIIRGELSSAETYRVLAKREKDPHKKKVLERLAQVEERHAEEWTQRLVELGGTPPQIRKVKPLFGWQAYLADTEKVLRRMEEHEDEAVSRYLQMQSLGDERTAEIARRVMQDEEEHEHTVRALYSASGFEHPAERILKREHWHVRGGSWIGDAIYGINDGLGAVFGIVSGMAGYSAGSASGHQTVLIAGLVGTLASALSMGSGAFLAAKSEREVYEAELARERTELHENPEEEIEELSLFYQLKGFSEEEAQAMARRLAEKPDQMLKVKAHEELGLSEASFPNPWVSLLSSMVSTAIGGIIPVLPFFFARGWTAVFWSAFVSVLAHFAVGAAKSLVTTRKWWVSGLEMTAIAFVVGVLTYLIGVLFNVHV